jgi:hypothetical protein
MTNMRVLSEVYRAQFENHTTQWVCKCTKEHNTNVKINRLESTLHVIGSTDSDCTT